MTPILEHKRRKLSMKIGMALVKLDKQKHGLYVRIEMFHVYKKHLLHNNLCKNCHPFVVLFFIYFLFLLDGEGGI